MVNPSNLVDTEAEKAVCVVVILYSEPDTEFQPFMYVSDPDIIPTTWSGWSGLVVPIPTFCEASILIASVLFVPIDNCSEPQQFL